MKVSVIIPVYNGSETIERCLLSALNQTFSDIEIIVVDDGSADNTLDIIGKFSDSRIKVITQENRGQGFARNVGLDAASGEYIGFLDADDTIEREMYEKMYEAAVKCGADIVQCNLTDVYPNGGKITQLSGIEGLVEVSDSAEYMSRYLAGYIHSYEVCNKLFRRGFIEENNLRFADTRKYFSEDILFNMEAVKRLKRIYFIKEPYYSYYQRPDSHMRENASERLCKMTALFDDYIDGVSGEIKSSASYLAAMTTMYNIGANGGLPSDIADRLKTYIKDAKKARMPLKKRLYLTAARYAPKKQTVRLAKMLQR